MKSNLGIHTAIALKAAKLSQLEWSKRIGIRQSTVNAIINSGSRPQPDSLAKIVAYCWPQDHHTGVSLLLEHLRDEIARARLRDSHPDARINMQIQDTQTGDLDDAITSLRQHAVRNADIRRLITDLLSLLEDQDRYHIAAEERPNYPAK